MSPPIPSLRLELAQRALLRRAGHAPLPLAARDAALLAWLAVEGPTPRQRLAALLWPDSPPDGARNALRQRLFQQKKLVGRALVVGDAVLALADDVDHDLAQADALLGSDAHDHGPEFATWLARERAQRSSRAQQSLTARIAAAEAGVDYPGALAHAEELLAREPLSELAHRHVIRLRYLNGDRAAALLAFDRCEQVLKDEVGVTPSAETLALLTTIQAQRQLAAPLLEPVPASVLLPPRLVGRESELAQLAQGFAAGQVVAVIGEAGQGKTRLLQTFAESRGDLVRAAGRPGDTGVPFATLARLLRALTERSRAGEPVTPDVVATLPAAARGDLARVLPELAAAPALRPAGEGQRLAMQQAVAALIDAAVARTHVAGLVVDDLHFADEASLDMLRALIDGCPEAPARPGAPGLRWLLAYRPAEAGSPVQALHDSLVEEARLLPLALTPLDPPALAQLVDSLALPGVSGAALAPGLHRRTGGNPLFVLETLKQAWVERRLASLADASALPRPLSVGRLIERRIAQLSPGALTLARVASIAGPDFSVALAEHVLQVSALQFADALNELQAAQVMRDNAFAHDLVFDAVRASVPATIAAHTHERIAAWLEPRAAEPARIAQHWLDAGQPQRALPWLDRAAGQARAALLFKEFIAFMERRSAIQQAAGAQEEAFESLLRAVEEYVNTDRARDAGERLCARLLALAATPHQRVRALLQRSAFEREAVGAATAVATAREALVDSTRLGDPALVADSHQALATALLVDDRLAEAVRHFELCLGWFDARGTDEERSELHGNLASLYDNLGRLEEALPHHELALRLAETSGLRSNATVVLGNLACNRLDAGDVDAAAGHLLRSLQAMALYDHFGAHRGIHHTLLALCECASGRYARALEHATLAQPLMREHAASYLPVALLREALIWRHLGQWARMQRLLDLPEVRTADKVGTRVAAAHLRWHGARALARPTEPLESALALLGPGERPDLQLPLAIDHATSLPAEAALAGLEEIGQQAAAIQHHGTLLAAHVRAAGLAAGVDPARGLHHARAALAVWPARRSTTLLPAEVYLHVGRALLAGDAADDAACLLAEGSAWLDTTAAEQVPAPYRESFLHRVPEHRALQALAARVARGERTTAG